MSIREERLQLIITRLTYAFQPTYLSVSDDSDEHIGHAGHQGGGRHFSIEITAESLTKLSRVAAHRKIYAVLADQIPNLIHALRINIK